MSKRFSTYLQILADTGVNTFNDSVKNDFTYMLREARLNQDGKPMSPQELHVAKKNDKVRPPVQANAPGAPVPQVQPGGPEQPPGQPAPPAAPTAPVPPAAPAAPVVPAAPTTPEVPPVVPGDPETGYPGVPGQEDAQAQPDQQPTGTPTANSGAPVAQQSPPPATSQPVKGVPAQSTGSTEGLMQKAIRGLGGNAAGVDTFWAEPQKELSKLMAPIPDDVRANNLAALYKAMQVQAPPEVTNNMSTTSNLVKPPNPAAGGKKQPVLASTDVSGDVLSEGKFGDMMSKVRQGLPGVVDKIGKGYQKFDKVTKNLHNITGGTHGTGGTSWMKAAAGDYAGKSPELNTVVNLMSKVINAPTPGQSQTAMNTLNANADFQEFVRGKTAQEKQQFLQHITQLAQLQQP